MKSEISGSMLSETAYNFTLTLIATEASCISLYVIFHGSFLLVYLAVEIVLVGNKWDRPFRVSMRDHHQSFRYRGATHHMMIVNSDRGVHLPKSSNAFGCLSDFVEFYRCVTCS